MVGDMLLAVAVVAIAAGTVPEFQFRIGSIGSAADSAAVGVGGLGRGGRCLIGSGIEGNHLWPVPGKILLCPFYTAPGIDPPGLGKHIQHITSKEQEIVGQGNNAEEIMGEGDGEEIQSHQHQIDQGENPGLHGNDEEQQKMGVGIHGGVAQKQAQIQIGHIGLSAKDQAPDVHHQKAGQVKQVEFKDTPAVFHSPSQRIVAEQGNSNEQQIGVSGTVDQRIGNQPPDLPLQDALPMETQQGIKGIVSGHLSHQIDNGSTGGDVKHQVGDAFIPVGVAEPFKPGA